MIKNLVVEVERRENSGKNAARRYRRASRIPAIVYGSGEPAEAIVVSPRRLEEILRLESGRNTIFSIAAPGGAQPQPVMIKELQRDPSSDRVLHIDLIRVQLDKAVTVSVPVRLIGTPEGVKNEGGVLDFIHRALQVECLPGDIPEHIDVDVTALHLNQHVSLSDLTLSDKIRVIDDLNTVFAAVVPSRAEVAATPAEGAAEEPQEPEVIKKGKEASGEGEEAAPKEKGSKEK
jgi:large subunit ribosomal protein L25